jgi:hypothetical protein
MPTAAAQTPIARRADPMFDLDAFPGGRIVGGLVVMSMIAVVLFFFARSYRQSTAAGANRRFDTVEIPPDIPGSREFIVRDDKTGSSFQFIVLHDYARITRVLVPKRHEGAGAERDMFVEALKRSGGVQNWAWPVSTAEGQEFLVRLSHEFPQLRFVDGYGNRIGWQ